MRKISIPILYFLYTIFIIFLLSQAHAVEPPLSTDIFKPEPITAEEAFWSVQTQTDPLTGEDASVALIDVRTRAEYFWVGAAAEVTSVTLTNGQIVEPDYGYAKISANSRFIEWYINGSKRRIKVKKIEALTLSPIAVSIPFKLWDENNPEKSGMYLNTNFDSELQSLADSGIDTVIFFCRSGGRSEACIVDFDPTVFKSYYEIDHPESETGGQGGFEGTSYGNVYNGYRGFPGRSTLFQDYDSVSWKDAGLPIQTSAVPPVF